jgi:tRNA/tmRNA/rRNA uracil-C5-methylase (TrmA/RlmC/RlmD family)
VTLAAAGYTVSQLHLVDLFPQTSHLETVAVLTHSTR